MLICQIQYPEHLIGIDRSFENSFDTICVLLRPKNSFMNYKFRVILDADEDVFRDIAIEDSATLEDLNNDSIPEIIAGNMGLNTFFKASKEKPLSLHYKDYDNNGSLDPIMCMYNPNRSQPVLGRDRILDQMTFLKKRVLRYETYSKMDLTQLFSKEERESEKVLSVTNLASSIFVLNNDKKYI